MNSETIIDKILKFSVWAGIIVLTLAVIVFLGYLSDYYSVEERAKREVQQAQEDYRKAKEELERIENGYGRILLTGGMVFEIP